MSNLGHLESEHDYLLLPALAKNPVTSEIDLATETLIERNRSLLCYCTIPFRYLIISPSTGAE